MEVSGSLLHRKPTTALLPPPPPPPPHPHPSSVASSSSFGEMEDLPFSLEDLPPEIRNKIDDIIDKNEDLESQLEAIDELLFADRLFAKFEGVAKYDIGSESGIGSDSDSGNGITPSTDPSSLGSSSASASTFFRPTGEDAVIDPRTFGPLPLQPQHDVDYLISRLIVPAPPPHPHPSSPSPSKSSVQHEAAQRNLTSRFHRPPTSSLSPTVGYLHGSPAKPAIKNADGTSSTTPPGLGAILGKESKYDSKDEQVRIARNTIDTRLESVDAAHESRSTPSTDPSQERNLGVSRALATKWEGKNTSGPAAGKILKNNNRMSANVATELSSLQSNTRQKAATLFRSSSRTELYAWGDVPGLPMSSVFRSPKPMDSEKSVSAIDSDAVRRSSQPSLETARKSKMFLKKDEAESESVFGGNVSGQCKNSKGLNGSTFDLKRNKWNSVSESLSKVSAEVTEGRGDISDDDGSDRENIEDIKKAASPIEDNFSSLVRLRDKNGKPSPMARINPRTIKAQSMLSLYDPSSDAKEKEKAKKSNTNKRETGFNSDSRKRLSIFIQLKKLKFHKKSKEGASDPANGAVPSDDAETELHRSDYLGPNVLSVPVRCSIPSPSLYSSLEDKNGNNPRTRSRSVGPGNISEIFRIDARDLDIDDDRPRLTFDTFRGQIEPIKWHDEKANTSETNIRNNASMTTKNISAEQSSVPSLAVNMSASNGNRHIHLNTDNSLHRPNGQAPVQNSSSEILDKKQPTKSREQLDNNFVKGVPQATLPVIKPAMHPVSKPLRIKGNVAGRVTASGASASSQATRVVNGVSSRISTNGLGGDSVDQRRTLPSSDPQSGLSNTNYDPKGVHSSGQQRGNSTHHTTTTTTDAVSSTNNNSLSNSERMKHNGNENRSYSVEQRLLHTTYDDAASACDRAVLDARLTLSSLLADRERILSVSYNSTPGSGGVALYRTRKELLASNCRHLVTDVKLMVVGATRSRRDLIDALTAAMHTFARVFEACRLTAEALPKQDGGQSRRRTLIDEVLKVGDVFLDTLSSGSVAAGRDQNDPAMEQLMYHTTEMAHSLGRLLNTIKSLDD